MRYKNLSLYLHFTYLQTDKVWQKHNLLGGGKYTI